MGAGGRGRGVDQSVSSSSYIPSDSGDMGPERLLSNSQTGGGVALARRVHTHG